ncbi:MAG: SAF domain-containing protein [Tessaracoccus sp.]|uniref:SAF domain-containing protein n=1 Tax=Tessaracoccus sp. TaxID=1971211 RepID=UPI001ED700C5|nr:SAF domain-containing protein [Tessaracoccus sp.]MBK7819827.1 SAF domain-containing protein [Tessaracoccus sp.]
MNASALPGGLRAVASFVSWHRRAVGALLAALSVLLLAESLTAPPPTAPAVVLVRTVAAGEVVTAADVRLTRLPPGAIPDGALSSSDDAVGQALAVPVGAGTVLQPAVFARATTAAKGRAVVPIVVADDTLRELLRPGDLISLVSAHGESPRIITGDARVVAFPATENPGALRVAASADQGALLVDVPASSAALVALLGQGGQLSVILGATVE